MTCNVCKKQYTGKRVNRFRLRWDKHKESDRKFLRGEEIKQKSLHVHFFRDDYQRFEEDVSICLIEKIDPSDPHKNNYYWIRTFKTIAPLDLTLKKHNELYNHYAFLISLTSLYYCRKYANLIVLLLLS